jgi:hypothetical protein
MHHDQYADVGIDLARGGFHRAHFKQLLRLDVDGPRLARLARLWIEPGPHGQTRQPADHRLFGGRELVDQLDHIVFQKLFLLRVEEVDGLVAVGGVGSGQPEIQLGAGGVQLFAVDA